MDSNTKRDAGVLGKTGCLSLPIVIALIILTLLTVACSNSNDLDQIIGSIVLPM